MTSTTILVCGDCRCELEKLGAVVDLSPREVTPGRSCQIHPTARHSQAMHAMQTTETQRSKFRASHASTVPELPAAEPAADFALVATVAAQLIATCGEQVSDDVIAVYVIFARKLVERAKG